MAHTHDGPQPQPQTRVVLRPLASPLPLGFLALAVATVAFATVQLSWIPQDQGQTLALGVLVLTVPLQLLAAVMGFLARDPVAATGMGILSGTWAAACLATLTSAPGDTQCRARGDSALLGPLPPGSGHGGADENGPGHGGADESGPGHGGADENGPGRRDPHQRNPLRGDLEGSESRTVLPLGRAGASRTAVDGHLGDQVENVASEPGARQQL